MTTHTLKSQNGNTTYKFINEEICYIKDNANETYNVILHSKVISNTQIDPEELQTMFIVPAPALYIETDTNNSMPIYVDLENVCGYSTSTSMETINISLKNSTVDYHYKYSEEFVSAINSYWT